MYFETPGEIEPLPFQVPLTRCCNCSETDGLEIVATPLKRTRYMLLAGTELTFTLELPYCAGCKRTAKRFRQGLFSKLLIGFGLFIVFFLVSAVGGSFLPLELARRLPESWQVWGSAAAAAVIAVPLLFFRRPKPPRTSRSQPVSLHGLGQKFSGQVTSMALAFTNARYAEEFARANQDAIAEGILKVVVK